jgi:hypothetical protein
LARQNEPSSKVYEKLHNIQLLIVDEISQLGAGMANYLNLQLQRVKDNNFIWGGICVLFCGDIPSQLPCVDDVPLWRNPDHHSDFIKEGIDLYRSMTDIIILREAIRSQFDQDLTRILYNFRRKHVLPYDIQLLQTRLESNLSDDELIEFRDSIRIFPTNKMVICIRNALNL